MVTEPQIQRADCEVIRGFSTARVSVPLTPHVIQGSTVFPCATHFNMHSVGEKTHIPGHIESTCGIPVPQVANEETGLILVHPAFLKRPGNFFPQIPVNVLWT